MEKYDYDAIIIGAGIGGLVCGCYLAKAGLKTLIVEKNAQPGGYCTSFSRNGFRFDACAHSLGSLRDGGNIDLILKELGLNNKLKFTRYDPQDTVIYPDGRICFWNDLNKTIQEFQEKFPNESKAVGNFFKFINECQGISFNSLRRLTFLELLDNYFKDNKIKSVLALPVLGNTGLPPSKITAFTAVTMFKEFILDGGYYPEGGMQSFSDLLGKKFKELKGDILLPSFVTKIEVKDGCAKGVEVNGSTLISARYVISNVDANLTFLDLVGKKYLQKEHTEKLQELKPSLSAFILYLGVKGSIKDKIGDSNFWFLPRYDIESLYKMASMGEVDNLSWFLLRLLPNQKSLIMLVNCPFKNNQFWKENKRRLVDVFIKKIQVLIPDISDYVSFKEAATPNTLYKWTLNRSGAAYGWESIPSQFAINGFAQITPIRNLYLTGHWSTLVQGIPGVAYLGRNTAGILLRKRDKMNLFALSGLFIAITASVLMVILLIFGKTKLHKVWTLFNFSVLVWGIGCFLAAKASSPDLSLFGWRVAISGGLFIGAFFYHTVYVFSEIKKIKILVAVYVQAFAYFILTIFTKTTLTGWQLHFNSIYYPSATFAYILMISSWVTVVYLGHRELIKCLRRSKGIQLTRARYLFVSFLIGFIGGGPTLLPALNINIYPFGNFGVAIYAFIGTYAVLRYQLLDLNVAFTRAGIFGVVYALVLGVPFWFGYKYNQWQYATWIMLVLATSGPFIYSYLRRHAENIILKEQRRYQQALRELAETMTHIRSLDALIQIITTTIVNAVKVNFAAMYVKEEESNSYVLKSCNPLGVQEKFPENLAFDSSVVKLILTEQRLITCDEIKHKPDIPLECGLVIPCFMENDLLAFIALGTKPNSQMFTTDDILVFETVSYSASLAIENCRFWREVEDKQRKARLQEMDTYSYSLAHEIDNPVHIILNETTLIKDYLLKNITNPQEYKEAESACCFTIEAARRVAGMVKAIRDFGSPVTGKALALKIEDVVESFFKLYYPQFKDKAIVFEKTFSGDLGFVRGIKPELMQVLVILANNSIHAMRDSEIKKITLKVEPVNHDRIRIVFSDTGYGIKKENLEIIFLPFTTTKASSEGTGMGLYNAKKIIERHKGKIFAQSEGKGQGACFVIELPKALDVTEEEFLREGQKEKRLI